MTRGAAITVENNFSQGLITEFTAMNFPENAITEGDNCTYSELGRVERRLGMDREAGYTTLDITSLTNYNPETHATVEFVWYSVNNDGTIQLLVQQYGNRIYFYSIAQDGSLSSGRKSFFIQLATYATPGSTPEEIQGNECQFTYGKGYLFIVHPKCEPLYVRYNASNDTITVSTIQIQIRDFEGLDSNLQSVDHRPGTLSNNHHYNLLNQGWYASAIVSGSSGPQNVLAAWDAIRGDFPSNVDIWWLFKNSLEVAYFGEAFVEGSISPSQINMGNTPAPKGHYIYSAVDVNRSQKTGIPGLPSQSSGRERPSAICWYAGRIFYAGIGANGYSDKIYFTQIIESDEQFGRCYQINDPTSETIFDLLDTDGGVITLPLMEKVIAMKAVGDALIVLGTNSIYTIRGSDNGPFRATDYTVEYVGPIGARNAQSIVLVDSNLMWINFDALYLLGKDQIGVYFQVQNVSKQSIQSLLDDIPMRNRGYIKGAYNKRAQKVQWVFSDMTSLTGYQYNRILELNLASRAFWTHTIDISKGPRVTGVTTLAGQQSALILEDVIDQSGFTVTDEDLEAVHVEVDTFIPASELFKYPVYQSGLGTTFAEMWDVGLVDWRSSDSIGASYLSYGVSGYRIRGEFLRSFNATPIAFVIENIPNGSVIVDGVWDYGARISTAQELYRPSTEASYQVRRVKLRGKGKSLQIRYRSQGNLPFSIIGWSTFDTGGTLP